MYCRSVGEGFYLYTLVRYRRGSTRNELNVLDRHRMCGKIFLELTHSVLMYSSVMRTIVQLNEQLKFQNPHGRSYAIVKPFSPPLQNVIAPHDCASYRLRYIVLDDPHYILCVKTALIRNGGGSKSMIWICRRN